MSARNTTLHTPRPALLRTLVALPARLARYCLLAVQAVAFWVGALAPLAYLPLFATRTVTDPVAFLGALALNAVALLCGHGYGRS